MSKNKRKLLRMKQMKNDSGTKRPFPKDFTDVAVTALNLGIGMNKSLLETGPYVHLIYFHDYLRHMRIITFCSSTSFSDIHVSKAQVIQSIHFLKHSRDALVKKSMKMIHMPLIYNIIFYVSAYLRFWKGDLSKANQDKVKNTINILKQGANLIKYLSNRTPF